MIEQIIIVSSTTTTMRDERKEEEEEDVVVINLLFYNNECFLLLLYYFFVIILHGLFATSPPLLPAMGVDIAPSLYLAAVLWTVYIAIISLEVCSLHFLSTPWKCWSYCHGA